MLKQFMYQNGFYTIIFACCVAGIIGKFCEWNAYRHIIDEAENAGRSENNLLKHLKLKVKSCYRLDLEIKNTRAFVEAYLYKCRFFGIKLGSMRNWGISAMMLCSVIGILAVLTGIRYQAGMYVIIYHAGAAMFSIVFMQLMETIFSGEEKKQEILVILEDYLDNFFINRLEMKELKKENKSKNMAAAALVEEQEEPQRHEPKVVLNKNEPTSKAGITISKGDSAAEKERIIAEVLGEFLA